MACCAVGEIRDEPRDAPPWSLFHPIWRPSVPHFDPDGANWSFRWEIGCGGFADFHFSHYLHGFRLSRMFSIMGDYRKLLGPIVQFSQEDEGTQMPKTLMLYHFMPTQYALQAVEKRRLKVADFDRVNDPYELLGFRLDSLTSGYLSGYPTLIEQQIEQLVKNYQTEFSQRYKMICLSETYKQPSLWGHYADKCKGICLAFDINFHDDPKLDNIPRVEYGENRKDLTYFGWSWVDGKLIEPDEYQSINIFNYKSIRWQYEEEWRLSAGVDDDTLELDPITGLYFYPFRDQLKLRKILIGFRCEEENIKRRFERLINDDDKYPDPKPEIIFTRLSSSAFEIEIDKGRQK